MFLHYIETSLDQFESSRGFLIFAALNITAAYSIVQSKSVSESAKIKVKLLRGSPVSAYEAVKTPT